MSKESMDRRLKNLEKGKKINSEEVARKYQKKSAKSRKKNAEDRKNLRLALENLLDEDMTLRSGETMPGAAAISKMLFNQALRGNVKAFETIRATVGQDPVQKVMVAEVDPEIIDEVEKIVLESENEE